MISLRPDGGFWRGAQFIPATAIDRQALALATATSWSAAPINDCADRADFATVLLAAARRGYPCLLPSSSAPDALIQLQAQYAGAALVRELPTLPESGDAVAMLFPGEQLASIGFTSGTTGQPKSIRKSWLAQAGVASRISALGEQWGVADAQVVATVPPQHTFGLEMTVMMALLGGWQVATHRPFYPGEIAAALAALNGRRILVTTPVHLRTLLADATPLPPLAMVLSATAPLDPELAITAEERLGCPVREIYGSTETGAIASRRTRDGERWELLPRVLFADTEHGQLQADHLPPGTRLPDDLQIHDARRFTLLGRPEGMLKVGGKRSSTAAVQQALLAIDGVRDAEVFLLPERERPVALIVADPGGSGHLRRELARAIDPVFIPRPMRFVSIIPRGPTGKARRDDLLHCWQQNAPRQGDSQA